MSESCEKICITCSSWKLPNRALACEGIRAVDNCLLLKAVNKANKEISRLNKAYLLQNNILSECAKAGEKYLDMVEATRKIFEKYITKDDIDKANRCLNTKVFCLHISFTDVEQLYSILNKDVVNKKPMIGMLPLHPFPCKELSEPVPEGVNVELKRVTQEVAKESKIKEHFDNVYKELTRKKNGEMHPNGGIR